MLLSRAFLSQFFVEIKYGYVIGKNEGVVSFFNETASVQGCTLLSDFWGPQNVYSEAVKIFYDFMKKRFCGDITTNHNACSKRT